MTQENFPQNNEGVSLEEALSAISAVNSELIGFQASQEAFNKLSSLKDRLEEGVSPSIIMKEAEDLRDLAEQAHNSSESLDIAA
jgi:hypothetical protein